MSSKSGGSKKNIKGEKVIADNRKANYLFSIEEVFEAGKSGRLKAAVKWGIGTDNVDFDACKKLNIPITNTPGMFGEEVADLAMCYILGLARDVFFID